MITLVPFAAKKEGQIGSYRLGQLALRARRRPLVRLRHPARIRGGDAENRQQVSEHFLLGDFLTKDQRTCGPSTWWW